MKRIAIFIDGTWNRPDAENPTNALRLSRCVRHQDRRDGVAQQVIYAAGVGAGSANTALGRIIDRAFGGGLGWGLLGLMEDTYRNLVFAYEPGDEIYIFGFSRGAFAARSLAGLIRSSGICRPAELHRLPEAVERYKSGRETTQPWTDESHVWRADFAPDTATSAAEMRWRAKERPAQTPVQLSLRYLGVWDTVKALGVPANLPFADMLNKQYRFHNAALSSSVWSARHAIAIDERRRFFPVSTWSNVEDLNQAAAAESYALGGPEDGPVPQRYQEQWFPGVHGAVGGGGSRTDLSSIALHWIAQGAVYAGLDLNWEQFDSERTQFSPMGKLDNKFGPVGLAGLLLNGLKKDRKGLDDVENMSLCALDRSRQDSEYIPVAAMGTDAKVRDMTDGDYTTLRNWRIVNDGWPTHEIDGVTRPRHTRPAPPPKMIIPIPPPE